MGLEDDVEKPANLDLGKITEQLGNLRERHKVEQIEHAVTEPFYKMPNVKKDLGGGKYDWRKEFSAAEVNKLGDQIFDNLLYHAHIRPYGEGASVENLNRDKNIKNIDGVSKADTEVAHNLGMTRVALKKILLENRDKLTPEILRRLAGSMMKKYEEVASENLYTQFTNDHREQLAKYITDTVKDKKFKKSDYKIKKSDTINELMPLYKKMAEKIYSSD